MESILQIPAILKKAETKANRALRLIFDSQEMLSDEQYAKIMAQHERLGWLSFLAQERKIQPEDVLNLPEIKDTTIRKTPSIRLRNVLYIWHEKLGGKPDDFPVFYEQQIEKLIIQIKDKLN